MKVHIISENPSDAEFAEQAISFEAVTGPPDSVSSAEEGDVVIYDYALGKKAILESIKANSGPVHLVFYDEIKNKDLRELEGGNPAPHAMLKRPVSEDFLMDVLSDFVDSSLDEGPTGDRTRTNPEYGELTFIGQKKNQKPETKPAPARSHDDEDNEADFESGQPMQEFKMSGEIKEIIKMHSLSADRTPALDSPENQNIQKRFDLVFPDACIPSSEEKGPKFKPIDEDLLRGIAEDLKPIEGVSLDLDGALEDLTADGDKPITMPEEEVTIPPPVEKSKPKMAEKAQKPEGSMTEKKAEQKEDASLMFDLGGDLDKELVGDTKLAEKSAATPPSSSSQDDLDLGDGDLNFSIEETGAESDAVKNAPAGEESEALPTADGLEMGSDDAEQHTTVFKGKSVELGGMDLPGGDDLVIDSVSNEGQSKKSALAEELEADEGLEFDNPAPAKSAKQSSAPASSSKAKTEDQKSDDLDLDLDLDMDMEEASTKIAAEAAEEEPVQEFDYKSAVKTSAKLPKAEDDLDVNLDDDIAIDAGSSELEELISVEEDEEEEDAPTRILTANKRSAASPKKTAEVIDISEGEDDGPMIIGSEKIPTASLNENDLVRLQATIRHLKGERESILKEVESLKEQKREISQENVGLRAEIDDLKIEISIIRKRHEKEVDQTKEQLLLHEERKAMYEEKLKQYQKEVERLNHKLRVDFTKVKQREKELESQLELQAMDSENQIKSRDKKILELKRKIDSLEFNMENASIREQKFREDKDKIEERMNKIIHTLRNSINVLEDDLDLDEETLEKIKKV
ncbi:MAG: hypothetical protein A2X86_07955 [Bdellovibrionales bacterium GWA2_49_15]|nr:MAG: hypothetical protein A2X86_07955 [Bdellovibrionales bacterium GWA2_49_15]HAZ11788.1 hypothetical protein [Bdellovibrionales bacterium]